MTLGETEEAAAVNQSTTLATGPVSIGFDRRSSTTACANPMSEINARYTMDWSLPVEPPAG